VREGEALPDALATLDEGRHAGLRMGERVDDVRVQPFGDGGRILVGEDVTERIRDRERLERSERLALVGQMLAQVTHEVRNPLNAMSLHAELLAEEVHTESERGLLRTILSEIRRLESVTERYLDLARHRPAELVPEDPVELARGVLALEDEALRRAGIAARVEGPEGLSVEVDGNALRRALLNLVQNAAEAGATHVTVRVAEIPGAVELRVEDDGPGMDPGIAERIFDPFFSTRARGTGLGLAITRQTLDDLGGTVRCETLPGQGTTFVLRIPR
jgi:signal transduction histidine kinase